MRAAAERWLNGLWYGGRGGAVLLAPLSALFGAGVVLRRAAYRRGLLSSHSARVPVVVVGNLSVGGTGKTPLAAWLAARLAARGIVAGVLLRGYGAGSRAPRRAAPDADPREVGDEAALLAALVPGPVAIAADRAAGCRLLEAEGAQLILCDDGLQHYALARDLEIAVVDGMRGLGNGRLLPAGPLREGAGRLDEVDFVVVQLPADAASERRSWSPGRPLAGELLQMRLRPGDVASVLDPALRRPLAAFREGPVHAVAGIGNPARFFDMLRAAGLVVTPHAFADHHAYAVADLAFGDARPILMTAKDAVKCRAFADSRLWEVPVEAVLSPEGGATLVARVAALLPDYAG